MDAFLLVHTLVEALLRAFLGVDKPCRSFNQLVAAYGTYLTDQGYPKAVFVGELQQLNQRRNRIVHQLWQHGYTYTNNQSKEVAEAPVDVYSLLIEWLETALERARRSTTAAATRPSRVGKKGMLVHIDPELPRRLKHLAVDEDKTLQQLGVEALEVLLASRSSA